MVTGLVADEFRAVIKLELNYVCIAQFEHAPAGQSKKSAWYKQRQSRVIAELIAHK